ncbi:uncharacterized protein LOC117523746 isoform X2 [Thalassophryne amazonica]|uniref:uncharacterized protein LOC117523746 isoform X2 n=1 Tax=Thalassophryne amazonica TaxID=390379 RepID=UPI001470BCA4|nr:uncharacterized protein LOC117523746 isoform X2 [Thalassophryne amazonica]
MLFSLCLLPLSVFQVFAEFNRIASKNLEGDFYEALDKHTPCFIDLFKSKKGTMGQKLTDLMQHVNWVSPDVTALRTVVLKGLPVLLSEDSSEVYRTCLDTTKEALASVTVGVLIVMEDAQQQGPNAVHLQPISTAIILEGGTVMDNVRDFPQAVCLLFGFMYALHLAYPKSMENTFRFIQAVMLGLGNKTLPPKLITLQNKLMV